LDRFPFCQRPRDIANLTTSRDAGIRYFYVSVDAVKHCFVHNNCLNQSGRVVVLTPGGIARHDEVMRGESLQLLRSQKTSIIVSTYAWPVRMASKRLFDFLHAERGSSI
jgi:hypothetical protein